MANTRDIRRRIRSVASTKQLTKAMKMVSAARLRRSQQAIVHARPYAIKMAEVIQSLATRVDRDKHPLLAKREAKTVEVVVISGDRGLCGSFNTHILRRAQEVIAAEEAAGRTVTLQCVGKKGRDFFRRRGRTIRVDHPDLFRKFDYGHAAAIAREFTERYFAGETDGVILVYNEFKSALQSNVTVERLLVQSAEDIAEVQASAHAEDYIYEPDAASLLAEIVPRYLEWQFFRALLESNAAEHAARMAAMDSARRNASELIESLTLHLNRVRQASITREIIEVVSGADALG
jgi:F-type H+-transporting ATPase subunit gamma